MTRSLIPWRERLPRTFGRMEGQMEKLMDRFFGDGGEWLDPVKFTPEVNVAERDESLEITVDLPGVKLEDVNIEVKGGSLWISGERKEDKEEKGKTFHRIERHFDEFRRILPLPTNVDTEKVSPEYHDGVFRLRFREVKRAGPSGSR